MHKNFTYKVKSILYALRYTYRISFTIHHGNAYYNFHEFFSLLDSFHSFSLASIPNQSGFMQTINCAGECYELFNLFVKTPDKWNEIIIPGNEMPANIKHLAFNAFKKL